MKVFLIILGVLVITPLQAQTTQPICFKKDWSWVFGRTHNNQYGIDKVQCRLQRGRWYVYQR